MSPNRFAFPFVQWRSPDGMHAFDVDGGMSLREWYAGQALSAFAAHWGPLSADDVAKRCRLLADALIAELGKEGGAS